MLYFAYGSNMNWPQISQRCPSASFMGVAKLADHKLAFTRKSSGRSCGVADAVPASGSCIWGAVFDISELDIGELDKSEGYRPGRSENSYWRRECTLFLDGDEARPLAASTYFATRDPNPPLPSQDYKDLIVSGARHWGLPDEYVSQLEQIEVL